MLHIDPAQWFDLPFRCPECGARLVGCALEWYERTGEITDGGLEVECVNEDPADPDAFRHRFWQSDWQPILTAAANWVADHVRVKVDGHHEFAEIGAGRRYTIDNPAKYDKIDCSHSYHGGDGSTMDEIGTEHSAMVQSTHHSDGEQAVPTWPSWTVDKASEETGYHPEWIRELCRQRKIEFERVGRMYLIKVSSLMQYIEELDADDKRTGPWRKGADGTRVE
jgi:excisionase family DNA binding protein